MIESGRETSTLPASFQDDAQSTSRVIGNRGLVVFSASSSTERQATRRRVVRANPLVFLAVNPPQAPRRLTHKRPSYRTSLPPRQRHLFLRNLGRERGQPNRTPFAIHPITSAPHTFPLLPQTSYYLSAFIVLLAHLPAARRGPYLCSF